MEECFESGWRAFDLAERLQTPVFVLSDLDLGMNLWMSEPFAYPDQPMDRGKVLSAEKLDELRGFARYGGRTTATASALSHAARHRSPSRGVLHARHRPQRAGASTASAQRTGWRTWQRLERKHDYARTLVPSASRSTRRPAPRSASSPMARPTRRWPRPARCWRAAGVKTSYLRLRALPITEDYARFAEKYPRIYVVENNFDGQMAKILHDRGAEARRQTYPHRAQWMACP